MWFESTTVNNADPPKILRMVLARNVRLARTLRGWSQERLAEHAALHRTYVGSVERGELSVGLDKLERLALALGVPAHVLLDPSIPSALFRPNSSETHAN